MALVPQGNDSVITDLDIRIWLRDNDPEANLLLDDLEFTPEELRTAMTLAVDYWNDSPPYLHNFDVNSFPYRSALLNGTVANLLFIAAHRYRRNDLQYNVPGGAVNDQARHKEYDAVGGKLWAQFQSWVAHNKQAINMEQGFAIVDPTYR